MVKLSMTKKAIKQTLREVKKPLRLPLHLVIINSIYSRSARLSKLLNIKSCVRNHVTAIYGWIEYDVALKKEKEKIKNMYDNYNEELGDRCFNKFEFRFDCIKKRN